MLADVVESGVAANHLAGLVLGLVHHLRVIGSSQLGHGHEGGPQRMGCVLSPQVTLDNNIDVPVRQPPVGEPLALAEGDKHGPRGPVEPLHPDLQGTDGT